MYLYTFLYGQGMKEKTRMYVYSYSSTRPTRFYPAHTSLFFPFLQYVYLNLSLINQAVLCTKWKWVIISNGGDVNHRQERKSSKESFLHELVSFTSYIERTVVYSS